MPSQAAPTPAPSSQPGQPPTHGHAPTPEQPPRAGEARPAPPDWSAIAEALRGITWREPRTAWRQLVELVGLPKLVVGIAVVVLVLAAFVLPGGARGDPFDGPGAAMDLVLKLGAVLALAYVSMAALKRYTSGAVSQRGSLLEVLDSTTLGPNRSVYVVRAGQKRLVLGVTQNQITALAELDADDAASTPTPTATPGQERS